MTFAEVRTWGAMALGFVGWSALRLALSDNRFRAFVRDVLNEFSDEEDARCEECAGNHAASMCPFISGFQQHHRRAR